MQKSNQRRVIILGGIILILVLGIVFMRNWKMIGSELASPMRRVLGVERVAQLETWLFEVQDSINQAKYRLGISAPQVPWSPAPTAEVPGIKAVNELPAPSPTLLPPSPTLLVSSAEQPKTTPTVLPTPELPLPSPTPSAWSLPDVKPFGELEGEGVWQSYIFNAQGEVVGLRTFLQPDPERPYAVVGVVAFDLTRTKLHFVLGSVEPSKPGGPHGTGIIPVEDKLPGKLLAAFNGGFIAEHGMYGAMADSLIALPAQTGLATLVIDPAGQVRLGEWGNDIDPQGDYTAWRQNAIMIVHDGVINPRVYTGTWEDWGANYDFNAVTLRSSLGLSADNQVLYYFAGPSLLMPPLAEAMAACGADDGMLLDINPTHAHFTAVRVVDGKLTAEPLFPEEMNMWVDRYVRDWPYEQDFFYITAEK